MPTSLLISAGLSAATSAIVARVFWQVVISAVIGKLLSRSQRQPEDNGVRQQVPPSSSNIVPVGYGDFWMGGTFADAVLSTDQKTMYYVMPIASISENGQFSFQYDNSSPAAKFFYGDRSVQFDSSDQTKVISLTDGSMNVDTKINGYMNVYLYTSTPAGVITSANGASLPNVVMGGNDIPAALRWPATGRQMNGLAFAIVKLVYNQDAGSTGLQPLTFKCRHTLNGTGVAKPGDVFYDYLTDSRYGCNIPTTNVDATACTALNAYSDEVITFTPAGGGTATTQPRYRINGVLDCGNKLLDNIDKILSACDSWLTYTAASGKWAPIINQATASVKTFNDDNIVGDIRIADTDLNAVYNAVEAQFPSKQNYDKPDFVVQDIRNLAPSLLFANEPYNKLSMQLEMVNDNVQAQYLCNRLMEQSRDQLTVSFQTTYDGIQIDAGDVIGVYNTAYGWTDAGGKLFRVVKVSETITDEGLGASIEAVEYNAMVFDNYNITQFSPAANTNLPSPAFWTNLDAPVVQAQNPSDQIPSIDLQFTMPTTGRVTNADLFYTTDAGTTYVYVTSNTYPQGFTPGSVYPLKVTGIPASNTLQFAWQVGNETAFKSALSARSTAIMWSPSISSTAAAVSLDFNPDVYAIPVGSTETSTTGKSLPIDFQVRDGTQVIPLNITATTDAQLANNTYRIGDAAGTTDNYLQSNLTVTNFTKTVTGATFTLTSVTGLTGAYLSVPIRYKDNAGNVQTLAQKFSPSLVQGGVSATSLDISGYTGFQSSGGGSVFSPAMATLTAVPINFTPTNYAWTVSGATPATQTGTSDMLTITPVPNATSISVTLVASSSATTLTKVIVMPVTSNGAAGINGYQAAFPSIYQWTGSSTAPAKPSVTSTYDWNTGAFLTSPSLDNGWSYALPSNTTAGQYLWEMTVPIAVQATGAGQQTLVQWDRTTNPITPVVVSYNGMAGQSGTSGSGNYFITISGSTARVPTDAEFNAVAGRNPIANDLATVQPSGGVGNTTVYRCTIGSPSTAWTQVTQYIPGSLIVQNTITGVQISGISFNASKQIKVGTGTFDTSGTIPTVSGSAVLLDANSANGGSLFAGSSTLNSILSYTPTTGLQVNSTGTANAMALNTTGTATTASINASGTNGIALDMNTAGKGIDIGSSSTSATILELSNGISGSSSKAIDISLAGSGNALTVSGNGTGYSIDTLGHGTQAAGASGNGGVARFKQIELGTNAAVTNGAYSTLDFTLSQTTMGETYGGDASTVTMNYTLGSNSGTWVSQGSYTARQLVGYQFGNFNGLVSELNAFLSSLGSAGSSFTALVVQDFNGVVKFQIRTDTARNTSMSALIIFTAPTNAPSGNTPAYTAGTNSTTIPTIRIAPPTNSAQAYLNAQGTWTVPAGTGGSGTVTSVATGTGLTGGPITETGTISLANTAVTAGNYTNASITVDAQGRLTAASSGTATAGIFYNVKSSPYNAKGDGTTDDTSAIQSAINAAANSTYGGTVYFPAGNYKLTSALTYQVAAGGDPNKRVHFLGEGTMASRLTQTGSGANGLTIGGDSANPHGYTQIEKLSFVASNGATGQGLAFNAISFARVVGCFFSGFAYGTYGSNFLTSEFDSCQWRFNIRGAVFERIGSTYSSHPNALTFTGCEFGANTTFGLSVNGSGVVNVIGGAIEGNGTTAGSSSNWGMRVADPSGQTGSTGAESSVGLAIHGVYFENNVGIADLYVDSTSTKTGVSNSVTGCSFNRISNSTFVTNNILLTAGSAANGFKMSVVGCGFKGIGYTASAARPTISNTNCIVDTIGCNFSDTVDAYRGTTDNVLESATRSSGFKNLDGTPYSTGGSGGVTQIVAGSNVTISPTGGTGVVTINATAGAAGVSSVTASAPLASSGGATPNISLTGVVPSANLAASPLNARFLATNGTANLWTTVIQQITGPAGATEGLLTFTGSGVSQSGNTFTFAGGGGSGTVTNVATGTGLTGGPITSTGTISLANTSVSAGNYTNANITVDAQGRITAASNGSGGGGGSVTGVTASAPLSSSGGTAPNITLSGLVPSANLASSPANARFLATNGTNNLWSTVIQQITGPAGATEGLITFNGSGVSQSGNTFTFSGGGSSGVSSFNSRTGAVTLSSSDVTGALGYTPPSSAGLTSVTVSAGTGMSGGGTISSSGGSVTLNNAGVTRLTAGTNVTLSGNTGNITISASGGGGGGVTSVGGTGSGLGFTLSGTVTSSGNITLSVPSAATLRSNIGAITGVGFSPSSGTGFISAGPFMTGGTGITVTGNGIDRLTFATTSDERLKYNVDFSNQDFKTIIPKIKIAKYNRNDKSDFKPGDYTEYGTTAQELEKVAPHLVDLLDHEDPDSIKGVNYQSLFAMNIKYTQFLQEQVSALEARVAALEAKLK